MEGTDEAVVSPETHLTVRAVSWHGQLPKDSACSLESTSLCFGDFNEPTVEKQRAANVAFCIPNCSRTGTA